MASRRYLMESRFWTRIQEQRKRFGAGVKAQHRVQAPPEFIDYWIGVPATLPEKLIFADLVRREVNFYFSYFFGDLPFTVDDIEHYRPDFLLPDYRIIIEVAGVYWHTRPGMWEYDYARTALLEAAGYRVFIFTDEEIMLDVVATLDRVPELRTPAITGHQVIIGDRPIDPSAAITARIRRWPKVVRPRYKHAAKGLGVVRTSYEPIGKPIGVPKPAVDPLFTHEKFDEDYLVAVREYGAMWLNYIIELGDYFMVDGVLQQDRVDANPDLYAYWGRWKDWWNRYDLEQE